MPAPQEELTLHSNSQATYNFGDARGRVLDDIGGHGEARGISRAGQSFDELVGLEVVKRDMVIGEGDEGIGFFYDRKLLDSSRGEFLNLS